MEPFALPFIETRLEKGFFAGFYGCVIGGKFFVCRHEIEGLHGGLLNGLKGFFEFVVNGFVVCDAFEGFEGGRESIRVFGELLIVFIDDFGGCVLFEVVLVVFH